MKLLPARITLAITATMVAGVVATALPASANTAKPLSGTTSVTTAPGIAATLLGAKIAPLPVLNTSFKVGFPSTGLNLTYGFPITGGNPNLSGPSGDILHAGGIDFVSPTKSLEIGKFDIDLADGKIFATQINFAKGRIAVLDLNLSKLHVVTHGDKTVLSGVTLSLDPAAAAALNATFGISLPTDGSLLFASAAITLVS